MSEDKVRFEEGRLVACNGFDGKPVIDMLYRKLKDGYWTTETGAMLHESTMTLIPSTIEQSPVVAEPVALPPFTPEVIAAGMAAAERVEAAVDARIARESVSPAVAKLVAKHDAGDFHGESARGGTFGERLKEVREGMALTQTDLAAKTGFQPSAISHFESGRRTPSLENLGRLADGLGVSVDLLMGRSTKPVAPAGKLVEGLRWSHKETALLDAGGAGIAIIDVDDRDGAKELATTHNTAIDAAFKAGSASRDAEVEAFRSNLHDVLRVLSCGDSELDEIKNSVKEQTLPSIRLTTSINYRSGMNARIKECKELRAKLAAMETAGEGEPGRWVERGKFIELSRVWEGDNNVPTSEVEAQDQFDASIVVSDHNAALDWWRAHHNRVCGEKDARIKELEGRIKNEQV